MLKRAFSTFLICTIFTVSGISQIRYVSQILGTPAGDGLTWATASNDLQAMLNDVPDGGTIRLEAGIYTPNAYPAGCVGCTYNRDFAFYANKNLTIQGGYLGGSATPVTGAHSTILSGDIGVLGNNSDNAHHVLLSNSLVALQNLSVRYGMANVGGSIFIDGIEITRINGAGIYVFDGGAVMDDVLISNNVATNQGGGFYGKNTSLNMDRCAITDNSANQGGGLFFSNENYQIALIEKSVIANNIANQGGAMYLSDPPRAIPSYTDYSYFNFKIDSCTYYGNIASNGSVLFSSNIVDAKMVFYNSVVYGNDINIHNHGEPHLPAVNSIIQGSVAGSPPIRSKTPDFINPGDLDGLDNDFFTDDDGLVPQITGAAALANIGAYLWNTSLCPYDSILYVDINNPVPGDGSSWATSFADLNIALNFARRCKMVQEVRVAQGIYNPGRDNWYPNEWTNEFKSATFILRPGLEVYGGYPTGGGTRNPAMNATILTGNTRNMVSIHETNNNAMDTTILDGFTIKGAFARMLRRTRTEEYFTNGAGIKIKSNYVKINGNIIKENSALKASAIEVIGDHVEISNNTITDHVTSPSTYFSYVPEGTLISVEGDSSTIQNNIISNNPLGTSSIILDIKGDNHLIIGNDIHSNPSLPISLQSFNSKCSFNSIKNNTGNGIKISGGSCQIYNNDISSNTGYGLHVTDNRFDIARSSDIYKNIISDNNEGGIYIKGYLEAQIHFNKITNNIGNGISLIEPSESIVSKSIEGIFINNNLIEGNNVGVESSTSYRNYERLLSIHHNIISKNLKQGLIVGHANVFNNFFEYNESAMLIALGNVFNNSIVNNVFGLNSGGILVHKDSSFVNDTIELHITNNTFYANKASNTNGAGALYISKFKGDTIEITNNIFYENSLGIFTSIDGSDYRYNKLEVDYPPIFKNNLLQLSSTTYAGVNNNNLGIGSSNNIFNGFPNFLAVSDLDGPDDVYMTRDDGLVLGEFSVGIDAGFDQAIEPFASIDLAGIPRILGPHTDIGAYEKLNCVTLDTIYVNKNHVHSTGGSGWLSALTDLDVALWLSHECTNVAVINVSADEYRPTSKPYEMQSTGKGIEMVTSDARDKTFHLRTGVNLYGGFIVRGGNASRNTEKNRTLLHGIIGDTSVLHTVMMSYNKDYWKDPQDTTLMDGFNIIGGMANETPNKKLTVNNNNIFKSQGGGITVYGGTNKIVNCTVESCQANVGGAIYLNSDTTIVENSVIKDNHAKIGAGIASLDGNYKFISNYFVDNRADTTACVEIKNGIGVLINNAFDGNKAIFTSGALTIQQGTHHITNNTFFDNESTQAGALFIDGGNYSIYNNIFHRNKKNDLFNVVGSDYLHSAATVTLAFNNNGMQLHKDSNYNLNNQNELGGGTANLFDINPIFYDTLNMVGDDNKYGTFDDGLRLLVGSPMINVGKNAAIPPYITTDIYGSPRIQKSIVELGAYEGPNVKCPESIFDTLFVDHTLTLSGNGSSWTQAFKTLDEAIFITHMCPFVKYICVAQGTYYPNARPYNMQDYLQGIETETIDPRDVTFHIRDGVVLLGGYNTGGTERNLNNFNTIFSGDINQNDSNQAYHPILMAASPFWFIREDTTIVDGIIVQNGNANNKPYALEVNNSLIHAGYGGGLYMTNGFHAVKNSTIEQNYADEKGGGVYSYGTKSTSIQNNSIKQNTSADGAGIFIRRGENFDMGYNDFSSNTAFDNGGGMYMDSTTNILHHNFVKSNIAKYGSGFYIKDQFKIEDSDFVFNTTASNGEGGGIYTTKSNGSLDRCAFDGNITDLHGGGLYTYLCDSIFVWNSLFHNNKATNSLSLGGAVYNDKNTYFEQINCTAYANNADEGESIYILSNVPILRNNIYYDSNPISILTGGMSLTNSIVKGGHPLCTSCPGTLGDIDPVFFDVLDVEGPDNKYRTEDDGFNVKISSPALDEGTSYRYMSHDITYRLRDWGKRDIGAYETFKCPTYSKLYVDKEVNGGLGLDWYTPLSEVSTALYVAQSCPNIEEIHVANGEYFPNYKPFEMQGDQIGKELYTTSDMDKTFHVRGGLYVLGGYKSSGTNRDRDLFPSILSGDIADSIKDARHVVLLGGDNGKWSGLPKIVFDGFHVTKGHAKNFGGLTINNLLIKYDVGAGIYADYLNKITLNDNVIHNNLGQGIYMIGGENGLTYNVISNNVGVDGGGAYFSKGFNTLRHNSILNNTASQGGGLFLYQDSTILVDNSIQQNESTFLWGGGLYSQQTNVTLIHNNITSNISKYGGGAYIENSNFKLDSNFISNNSTNQFGGGGVHFQNSNGRLYKNGFISNNAIQSGGGLSIAGGDILIESNLFTKNKTGFTGGGINAGNADLLIVNNVFHKDTARSGSGIQTYYGFSEIQNNTFFQNEGSIDGGAFGTALGANDLTNNIFYENTKSGANVIGADFYNDVFNESFNVFNNNAMQFAENDYNSANNNVLYVNAANVYNSYPLFVDGLNILGVDMIFGNGDDGLILQTTSPFINVGNKNLIADSVKFDAKYEARVMNYQVDLGAYETFRDPCISNVIYVDTNVVAGYNGQSWSKAFQTLSEALFVAHTCPNVDTILITEGTYFPETKPYEMDVTMKGQEITTGNDRDLTFHIRQGLTIIGGFPGGGDDSPSTAYKTNLVGRKEFSSFPSYHTLMMDTSAMWTNTNKQSSIQYCIIKGGVGETGLEPDSIFVNGSWLNNSKGGGVYINGAPGLLKYNTIKENDASSGGGLFIVNSSAMELVDNEINNNFAEKEGAGVSSVQSFLELLNTNVLTNNSSRDDLRGLTGLESIIKLMGNNIIEGMNCKNGTVESIGLNTIK